MNPATQTQPSPRALDNPLRQYFRQPAIYMSLPSGGNYPPGVIDMPENRELPVYPMTTVDEINARTPDALFNGTAVVKLITSCIPCIKQPGQLLQTDMDAILAAIRIASNGSEMEIQTTCPECKEESKYDLDLNMVLSSLTPGNYDELVRFGTLSIKFRSLTLDTVNKNGVEQFTLQKTIQNIDAMADGPEKEKMSNDLIRNVNLKIEELLAQTIESISTGDAIVTDTKFIQEFLMNCDLKTHNAIRDKGFELSESSRLKPIHVRCINCSHEYDQPFNLNISDFFD